MLEETLRKIVCDRCQHELNVNEVLKALRFEGYITYFKVKDRKTGEIQILPEPQINPYEQEIIG